MNFILDGRGHTLNGNNASVIFSFFKSDDDPNPYNVTIKNINFINANGNEQNRGGALNIERALLILLTAHLKTVAVDPEGLFLIMDLQILLTAHL